MAKPEDAPAELIQVIVRRSHSEDEGHHGGVWKIAYADFMTAMMAFFLVMWLVNAANTEMKASVASYFNPIKLSDNVIRKKGLLDVDGKANAVESQKARTHSPGQSDSKSESQPLQPGEAVKLGSDDNPGKAPEPTDQPFGRDGNADQSGRASDAGRAFRDPFNPFAPGQLMTKEGAEREVTKGEKAGTPAGDGEAAARRAKAAGKDRDATSDALAMQAPAQSGEAREPLQTGVGRFAHDTRASAPAGEAKAGETKSGEMRAGEMRPGEMKAGESKPGEASSGDTRPGDVRAGQARSGEMKSGQARSGQTKAGERESDAAKLGEGAAEALKAETARQDAARQLEASASNVLRDIQTAVKPVAGDGGPGIEVTIEGNGIVLSLTDTSTFGMFSIGSAEPSKQTLDLIARIAPVLAANSKRIVVRGHTDSRIYRTQSNNNWRLSVSRAEAAYAMLVRSGIDEQRFNRIEGYADRKPKVPTDPEAAANRRIEILLQQVEE